MIHGSWDHQAARQKSYEHDLLTEIFRAHVATTVDTLHRSSGPQCVFGDIWTARLLRMLHKRQQLSLYRNTHHNLIAFKDHPEWMCHTAESNPVFRRHGGKCDRVPEVSGTVRAHTQQTPLTLSLISPADKKI